MPKVKFINIAKLLAFGLFILLIFYYIFIDIKFYGSKVVSYQKSSQIQLDFKKVLLNGVKSFKIGYLNCGEDESQQFKNLRKIDNYLKKIKDGRYPFPFGDACSIIFVSNLDEDYSIELSKANDYTDSFNYRIFAKESPYIPNFLIHLKLKFLIYQSKIPPQVFEGYRIENVRPSGLSPG